MKRNLLLLSSLLSLGIITGCNGGGDSSIPSQRIEGFDPVLEYKGDIDVFMYIYGQDLSWLDVGDEGRYGPEDIIDGSQALFFAAAREFKKLYPDIKINVISGNGDELFNQNFNNYTVQKGHVPHVMHHIKSTPELLTNGLIADFSQYKEKFETYDIINPELMQYFNYGGFQGAVPYGCFPQGVYVNYDALDDIYFDYSNLASEWTVDTLNEIITAQPMGEQSGLIDMNAEWMDFIVPTINKQYIENGSMDLNTSLIKEMVSMEANWYNYSAFDLNSKSRVGTYNHWEKLQMFVDGASRIMLDRSYNMGSVAQIAIEDEVEETIDFYPWPALDEDEEPTISLNFGAINIGNLCPVGTECTEQLKLAQEAAAYFAMFMVADTRSIKAASEIEWTTEGETKKGAIKGFPVVKPGSKLSFLENEDEYETQLEYFFSNYPVYKDKQGFDLVLDLYETSELYVCGDKVYPFLVPEGGSGGTKNILKNWKDRYKGDGTFDISASTWVGWVETQLPTWTTEINRNSSTAWAYLTEQMMSYYDLADDFDASLKI